MSKILVDQIRSNSASSDALTLDGSGNVTVPGNITLSGTATGFPTKATNLVINGAMNVAQRSTSATVGDNSYATVDRFKLSQTGLDEDVTQAQVDVASGTTPYTLGFRKAFKITNGNQTSGAGTSDLIVISTKLEAQDIANSGWNYLSASSNITLSFWVKSSVAQNFYFRVQATDGTTYSYVMETGSLSADTWTKITKTIPGNSNLTFNNDNGEGLLIRWALFRGTANTGTRPLNAWAAYDGSTRYPDNTSTWFTTNDATFEITGVQLEVGDTATDFEHRSYGQELALCQRYYQKFSGSSRWLYSIAPGYNFRRLVNFFPVTMRTAPTMSNVTESYVGNSGNYGVQNVNVGSFTYYNDGSGTQDLRLMTGYEASAEL